MGLAAGTLIAGLYGMNLKNFLEESEMAFGGISLACFGLSAIVCMYGMWRLRRVQKLRMWGEGRGSDWTGARRNWRSEAMEHAALPWENRADRMAKQKDGKGPVLWPGMDGLGVNCASEHAPVTIGDDLSSEPQKAAETKRRFPPAPSIPLASPVNKGR